MLVSRQEDAAEFGKFVIDRVDESRRARARLSGVGGSVAAAATGCATNTDVDMGTVSEGTVSEVHESNGAPKRTASGDEKSAKSTAIAGTS